jgi:hypothetical protein
MPDAGPARDIFSSIYYYEGITNITGIHGNFWESGKSLINHLVRHYAAIKKIMESLVVGQWNSFLYSYVFFLY